MSEEKNIYCDDCFHITIPTNRKPLSKCDRYCDKYNVDLAYYDGFLRCYKCYNEYDQPEEILD